jgi:ATP-binding cassette subfamily C protein CydD
MSAGAEHDPGATLLRLPSAQTRWLSAQVRGARTLLGIATASALAGGVLMVGQAWLLAHMLDAVVAHGASLADVRLPALGVALLVILRAGLAWAADQAGSRAAENIKLRVRVALFERLSALGPTWSRGRSAGELAGTVVDHVDAFEGFFARYLPSMVTATLLPIAFSVTVLPFDVVAGLVLLVTAPLIPVFMALVGWGAEAASRRHLSAFARLSGFFADRLRGASTLKLFGRADAEADSVAQASDALRRRTMEVLRIAFLSSAVLEFFAALGVAGVAVYFGLTFIGYLDLRGTPLTLGTAMFCLMMAPEVYAPLRQFATHYHDRAAARAAVAQLHAVFDGLPDTGAATAGIAPAEVAAPAPDGDAPRGAALSVSDLRCMAPRGRDGMSADTEDAGAPPAGADGELAGPAPQVVVLDAVSFALAPGEHVALMGPSGCGKSTLLETLARLRPAMGKICLDGEDIGAWDEAALRARLLLIGQRPYLFGGTLAENIALGLPAARPAALRQAAAQACVTEFSDALALGLDTPLADRGHGLSGGQAQRVALARLFLRAPGVILLDEPTAHLDAATEDRLLDAIIAFARGRTLLLATHSPRVAARFGRVLSINDGKVLST